MPRARADAKSMMPTLAERATQNLEELGDAPDWKPLFLALASMIESRYQTYTEVFGLPPSCG